MTRHEAATFIAESRHAAPLFYRQQLIEQAIDDYYWRRHGGDPFDAPCPECGLFDAHTSNCVKLEEG